MSSLFWDLFNLKNNFHIDGHHHFIKVVVSFSNKRVDVPLRERVSPGGRGFSVRVWSGAAVANVCGKRSRASHGVWSLLVLSALADSSEGFDGTHQKPSLCFLLPYVPCWNWIDPFCQLSGSKLRDFCTMIYSRTQQLLLNSPESSCLKKKVH